MGGLFVLLAARHREELARQPDCAEAVAAACRATAPPVLASAATVACAMTTLTFSDRPTEQGLPRVGRLPVPGPPAARRGARRRGHGYGVARSGRPGAGS
ncbi:hypothetical protein GCM10010215_65080 [Streptomyces virginiae]|uniref:MMPL family transporter n=1 Tax=Streptomyces virginiae TaxID=1961 RepID=UPI0017818B3D|nr:MMPL family transporter [Streptomyces virginiae]GGQ32014.1 hypothetical protein GCM10010215_65080 [Streptomyces virginiae]